MKLVPIEADGSTAEPGADVPPALEVRSAMAQMYSTHGYHPPWIGYLAFEDAACVGTCAFKSPPAGGRVEIAYFTFPGHEGRGVATRMVALLLSLATAEDAGLVISAQTLPEETASTRVLRNSGFTFAGEVAHPEDGTVWEWTLRR